MRILLVNPPYLGWKSTSMVEPIGLLYIAAYLRANHFSVRIFDFCATSSINDYCAILEVWSPEIVGVSVYTVHSNWIGQLSAITKRHCPHCLLVSGGAHVTFEDVRTLTSHPSVDVVVRNEGEETLLEVASLWSRQKNMALLSPVAGITYRANDGSIIRNDPRALASSIDAYPFPARDLLPPNVWDSGKVSMITGRGCYYRCGYCVSPRMFGRARRRSVQNVVNELHACIDALQIRHVNFYDDVFPANADYVQALSKVLRQLGVSWDCYVRIELCSYELLRTMRESGCRRIRFGVESGVERIRRLVKGGTAASNEQHTTVVRYCRSIGIQTWASYVIGFPEETEQDIVETIRFADSLNTDGAGFFKLTPYPGTAYARHLEDQASVWESHTKHGLPVSICSNVGAEDLDMLLTRAYRRFYARRPHRDEPDILKFLA